MARRLTIKDPIGEMRLYRSRLLLAAVIVVAMIGVLVARFFSLQVVEHEIYRTQSERNRVHVQSVPPKRGLIFDRNGILLAENTPSQRLVLVRERVDDMDATLDVLQELLGLETDEIEKFRTRMRRSRPFEEVPIRFQLNEEEIARIAVNRYRLPGVKVVAQLVRHYPEGTIFAHSVGYVGRINEREQAKLDNVNYAGTYHIGKIGLERYYEDQLHGLVGYQNVETNARGKVLRVLERTDPVPGSDLHLHIDAQVQRVAHEALGKRRGSVVALDVETGGVIAMVSTPSYDANLFVSGISSTNYTALRDSPDLPLFNRSLQGQYPPASTVKPLIGLAGLDGGYIDMEHEIRDPGWFQLPGDERLYRDWKRKGHAPRVGLELAIKQSCDTYFYDLAYRMGVEKMHDFLQPFGLGQKTGIDIVSERPGLLPSPEWKRKVRRMPWFPGETVNLGIGQGLMLMTPLQIASFTATIANRGVVKRPQLVATLGAEKISPLIERQIAIKKPEHWQNVIDSMHGVVHSVRGTAHNIARGIQYQMAGKTGTAQVVGIAQDEEYDSEALSERNRDHALFMGYAPLVNPKIALAVVVENGEGGASVAAPVARKVLDAYLLDDRGQLKQEFSE